ncbi:MAG: hypothetical protein QXF52_02070 [Thermoproteota archaeon]
MKNSMLPPFGMFSKEAQWYDAPGNRFREIFELEDTRELREGGC